MREVIFESVEKINDITFDVTIMDNGAAAVEIRRRRTSILVTFSVRSNTLKIMTRRAEQIWKGVPSVRDMFFILEDESTSKKWTPAQCDLMWDVSRI